MWFVLNDGIVFIFAFLLRGMWFLSRELSIIMSLGPTDDDAADGLEKNVQYNVVST